MEKKANGENTTYVLACAPSGAAGAVQEVLLQSIAPGSKLWACTAQHAVAVVTSIRIVALSIAAHDGLALHVSARALTRRASESVATVGTIGLCLVFGAIRRGARASFLWIAGADRGAADGIGRGELAVAAAVLVGIVTDGIVDELARLWVAACVVFATRLATTVALLVAFDDAVTAGRSG